MNKREEMDASVGMANATLGAIKTKLAELQKAPATAQNRDRALIARGQLQKVLDFLNDPRPLV